MCHFFYTVLFTMEKVQSFPFLRPGFSYENERFFGPKVRIARQKDLCYNILVKGPGERPAGGAAGSKSTEEIGHSGHGRCVVWGTPYDDTLSHSGEEDIP